MKSGRRIWKVITAAPISAVCSGRLRLWQRNFDLNELIRLADERMYENKRAIKNQESRAYRIGK